MSKSEKPHKDEGGKDGREEETRYSYFLPNGIEVSYSIEGLHRLFSSIEQLEAEKREDELEEDLEPIFCAFCGETAVIELTENQSPGVFWCVECNRPFVAD